MTSLIRLVFQNAKQKPKLKQSGFTLLEMVTVIVLLGIISVGVTTFIRFGTQIFTDNRDRDELIGGARFAVERMNRELRAALPNSIRNISGSNEQCVEFLPLAASRVYLDVPVAPEPATNTIQTIRYPADGSVTGLKAVVYPLFNNTLYGTVTNNLFTVDSESAASGQIFNLQFGANIRFGQDSPTSRIFFVEDPVAFCIVGSALYRYSGYTGYAAGLPDSGDVLMAKALDDGSSKFNISQATRSRNAIVTILLTFSQNNEVVSFNNEVQTINVP